MVNVIKKNGLLRLVLSLLIMAITANVSAQNYPARGQGTYSSRPTRSSGQSDLGESIVKGVGNLFKKKDKDKNKDRVQPKKDKQPKGQPTISENVTSTNAHIAPTTSTAKSKAEDDVELVVSADGTTKEQATLSALRSALEQAFGTFVSSNTTILNDELVKDEIISVSTGNIKEYQYLSESEVGNKYYVTIKAIVSVGKLVQYVKSKGGETELAGATFAMNLKMKRLQEANQKKAEETFIQQLYMMSTQAPLFNYEIKVGEPRERKGVAGLIEVPFAICAVSNGNLESIIKFKEKTLADMPWVNTKDLSYGKSERGEFCPYEQREGYFKFKIVDNLREYPFYRHDMNYYSKDGPMENGNYIRGKDYWVKISSLRREILEIHVSPSSVARKLPQIHVGYYSERYPYDAAGTSHLRSYDNVSYHQELFSDLAKSIKTENYNVVLLGVLRYSEEDISKITNISVVPVAEFEQAKQIEHFTPNGMKCFEINDDI